MTAAAEVAAPRLVRRNYGRGHGYQLDGEKVLGVTTVVGTLDKPALTRWYAEQAAKRVLDDWDRVVAMTPSERFAYVKDGPRDVVRAAALRGTEIHALGDKLARGEDVEVPDEHRGPVEAYARFLDRWDVETWHTETPCAHTGYRYAGTADLWGVIGRRDERALLDVKTGKGVWSEVALQLAAYRFTELLVTAEGEVATPEVDAVYVAHVLPDDVRLVPVQADRDAWRTFLYLLEVARARQAWGDWPLVGEAVTP